MADDRPRGSLAKLSMRRGRWEMACAVLLGALAIGAWYLPSTGFWLWGLLHWQSTGIGCLALILLSQAQYHRGMAAGYVFGSEIEYHALADRVQAAYRKGIIDGREGEEDDV